MYSDAVRNNEGSMPDGFKESKLFAIKLFIKD